MLGRYRIIRGKRPANDARPKGICQDCRAHTRHCLRPDKVAVNRYLADPSPQSWRQFRAAYLAQLKQRFQTDRAPFDELADLAMREDVFIGCNCPTRKNPDLRRCHTILALQFMRNKYRRLQIELPQDVSSP